MKSLMEVLAEARALEAGQTSLRVQHGRKSLGGTDYTKVVSREKTEQTDEEFAKRREPIIYDVIDPEDRTLTCGIPTDDVLATIEALASDDEVDVDEVMALAMASVTRDEDLDYIPESVKGQALYWELR